MKGQIDDYQRSHRNKKNRILHMIGIPIIITSLPLFFYSVGFALVLFFGGWTALFIGHWIEGNRPAILTHPIHVLSAPVWWIKELLRKLK